MTIRMLPALLLGTLVLVVPCLAQEKGAAKPENLPEPDAVPAAPCATSCESTRTTYKVEWLTREVPTTVEKWAIKEVDAGQDLRCGFEIDWREETRVRTLTTLKPREVPKEVIICTNQPVEQIDPATGCKCIVMVPKTETKIVKEIVFETETKEEQYKVRIPCLKRTEKVVNLKHLALERNTVPEIKKEGYGILVPTQITERVLVPAKPCCEK